MAVEIKLTKGYFTFIDEEDLPLIEPYTWRVKIYKRQFYYASGSNYSTNDIRMHRLILGLVDSRIDVDHVDGDGLNNRRSNLRVATRSQNMGNRVVSRNNQSGYKGVCWNRSKQKYEAYAPTVNGRKYLGQFVTAEEAARKYDEAALSYWGEFALTNF